MDPSRWVMMELIQRLVRAVHREPVLQYQYALDKTILFHPIWPGNCFMRGEPSFCNTLAISSDTEEDRTER